MSSQTRACSPSPTPSSSTWISSGSSDHASRRSSESHERASTCVAPELGVRAVRDAAGEGRGVVLLERLVPGGEVAPVRAVERPHDALAGAHPALQVHALVDVGDDPERLGEAVGDLARRARRGSMSFARRASIAISASGSSCPLDVARGVDWNGRTMTGRPEVLAVLHPLERRRQARVVDVAARRRLRQRRQQGRDVGRVRSTDELQLDDQFSRPLPKVAVARGHG